jgi:hypothetical protein
MATGDIKITVDGMTDLSKMMDDVVFARNIKQCNNSIMVHSASMNVNDDSSIILRCYNYGGFWIQFNYESLMKSLRVVYGDRLNI